VCISRSDDLLVPRLPLICDEVFPHVSVRTRPPHAAPFGRSWLFESQNNKIQPMTEELTSAMLPSPSKGVLFISALFTSLLSFLVTHRKRGGLGECTIM